MVDRKPGSVLRSMNVVGRKLILRDVESDDFDFVETLLCSLFGSRSEVDLHELVYICTIIDLLCKEDGAKAPNWLRPPESSSVPPDFTRDVDSGSLNPDILDREIAWLPIRAEQYRGSYQLVMLEQSSDMPVGYLCTANFAGSIYISAYLHPEKIRSGYGAEAIVLLIRQLFEIDGAQCAFLATDEISVTNMVSGLDKIFTFESRSRAAGFWNGAFRDRLFYSLSKQDWDSNPIIKALQGHDMTEADIHSYGARRHVIKWLADLFNVEIGDR